MKYTSQSEKKGQESWFIALPVLNTDLFFDLKKKKKCCKKYKKKGKPCKKCPKFLA